MSPEKSPGVREASPGGVRFRRGQGPAGVGQRGSRVWVPAAVVGEIQEAWLVAGAS